MAGKPCPRCGGADRFYQVLRPRKGGAPFWHCSHCRHVEVSSDFHQSKDGEPSRAPKAYNGAALERIQAAYAAVAEWCAVYLWSNDPEARAALTYLRNRGFTDETILKAKLGYHPRTWGFAKSGDAAQDYGVGGVLFHRDRDLFTGAQLGGLLGPQGRPKGLLRNVITIPYLADGKVPLLRTRTLNPDATIKYFSPAGVVLYAGGPPVIYGADQLNDTEITDLILTEGEFKALMCQQIGIPAVAQPGIGYLPDEWLQQFSRKRIIVAYDVEARKDPFEPSPGERFSLRVTERVTGADLKAKLDAMRREIAEVKAEAKHSTNADTDSRLLQRLEAANLAADEITLKLELVRAMCLRANILRLPRDPDQAKVDLDGYIVAAGADAVRARIAAAPSAEDWYARHAGGGYAFTKGGLTLDGKQIANYQARIIETIYQSDGARITTLQRLALRTPSGRIVTHDVSDDDWADDRAARHALRKGLREGTFDDDAREVLRAIRLLSSHGDPPVERSVYTCTGWEQIRGKWHFLSSDGAIAADGVNTTLKADMDPSAMGNHYALCVPGDAQAGATAWLRFLRGEVCPQPLALVLAAQAALPLIHRFLGTSARSMVWLFQQSGAFKTSLTRAGVLALYGPAFTAVRTDAAPVPKWDGTATGLSFLPFYYRDMPLLIDDYKQGSIKPDEFKKFIHNYSESTGRTRATKQLTIDRIRPARSIIFATAEDLPHNSGDLGIEARLLAMPLQPGAINADALTDLQRAGVKGDLVAFWRGFIQNLAASLDQHGETGVQTRIRDMFATNEAANEREIPGHRRVQGALEHNRAAWLTLSTWLVQAGYLTESEAAHLNRAHLDAREHLAQNLNQRQKDTKPGTIFVNTLRELLSSGDLFLERGGMICPRCESDLKVTEQGWFCTNTNSTPCTYHLSNERIIGFVFADGESAGVYPEKAFREVSRVRRDQNQPFTFTKEAIWQQLDNDGVLLSKNLKENSYRIKKRNPHRKDATGKSAPTYILHLKLSTLTGDDPDDLDDESDTSVSYVKNAGSSGSSGSLPGLPHSSAVAHASSTRDHEGSSGSFHERSDSNDPDDPAVIPRGGSPGMPSERSKTDRDPVIPRNLPHARAHEGNAPGVNWTILKAYLRSPVPAHQQSAREICAGAGLDYAELYQEYNGRPPEAA